MRPVEQELLNRVLRDQLRLDPETGAVLVWHGGHRRWVAKRPDAHPETGRLRYRFDCPTGARRLTVYRNRLVWMIANRRPIPDDCHVDHKNEDRLDDRPDNLRLMPRRESYAQGRRVQEERVLERLCRWFDFLGQHGREPVTMREINWVEDGF